MTSALKPLHAPFDEPSLALVCWPSIPASNHHIVTVAVDFELGLCATGTSVGWIYLWRLSLQSHDKIVPRLACVAEWSGSISVLQCHFCRWPNSGLLGTNFSKILVSLHGDGMLRLWTIDDGRCIYAFPTISFLGVNPFISIPLFDSRYLLLVSEYILVIYDLWSHIPALVLLLYPIGADTTSSTLRYLPLTTVVNAVSNASLSRSRYYVIDQTTSFPFIPRYNTSIISASINSSTSIVGHPPSTPYQTIISAALSNGTLLNWDVTLPLLRWDRKTLYATPIHELHVQRSRPSELTHTKDGPKKESQSTRVVTKIMGPQKDINFPDEFVPENSVILVTPLAVVVIEPSEWNQQVININIERIII